MAPRSLMTPNTSYIYRRRKAAGHTQGREPEALGNEDIYKMTGDLFIRATRVG